MSKPILLDLFCGAGGAARGYQRAGFHVIGVDIHPQPHYVGDEFVQADAMHWLRWNLPTISAFHASPPCQAYSVMRHWDREYPALIPTVIEWLGLHGKPWVVENVERASPEMPGAVTYCGAAFGLGAQCADGWRMVRRHRLFASNVPLESPGCQCSPTVRKLGIYGHSGGWSKADKAARSTAMGIEWMTIRELSQAIPPAYTEHIGRQLLAQMRTPHDARVSEDSRPVPAPH
jgi:DNA (cytosine-5)-methyltransferase 1